MLPVLACKKGVIYILIFVRLFVCFIFLLLPAGKGRHEAITLERLILKQKKRSVDKKI